MTVPQLRGGDCSTYIGLRRGDSAGGRDLLREGIEENVQRKRRKKTFLFFNFNYFSIIMCCKLSIGLVVCKMKY
jgi:hypothetical protein